VRTFRYFEIIVLCLASAGCGPQVVATLKDKTMVAGPECEFPRLAQIPIEKVGHLWTVPAKIDDYNVLLALDTGAYDVLISSFAATAMELPASPFSRHMSHVGLGGISTTKPVWAEHFAIGGFDMLNVTVDVGSTPTNSTISPPLIGLLGRTYLGAFDVEIDFPNKRLALYGSRHCAKGFLPWQEPYDTIPIKKADGDQILVDIQLDGKKLEAELDTGAVATTLASRGARQYGLSNEAILNGPSLLLLTPDGHNSKSHLLPFETLKVGAQTWNNPELAVQTYVDADAIKNWLANPTAPVTDDVRKQALEDLNPPMLLGLDFLEHYKIWISFATRQVFLAPSAAQAAPS